MKRILSYVFLLKVIFFPFVSEAGNTFIFPEDYVGPVYVVIKKEPAIYFGAPHKGMKIPVEGKIIWGPWEGKFQAWVNTKYKGGTTYEPEPVAVFFEKKKKDRIPLTVIAGDAHVEFYTGKPDKLKYNNIIKPNWKKRE